MLILRSPAKINLCLDILKKTADGYHEISTILCIAETIYDEITLKATTEKENKSTVINHQNRTPLRLTTRAQNLLDLAVSKMQERAGTNKFISIEIEKAIPFGSGLGGFSSNLATVLKGLNVLWDIGLNKEELKSIGAELGMDVVFFLDGSTICHATHYGEVLTPIHTALKLEATIFPQASSDPEKTKNAFSSLSLALCGKDVEKTSALIAALKHNQPEAIPFLLHNDFNRLYAGEKQIPGGHCLSGAGPSTFTLKVSI